MRHSMISLIILSFFMVLFHSVVTAQNERSRINSEPAALVFDNDTLFVLSAHLGAFSPAQRVIEVGKKLNSIIDARIPAEKITDADDSLSHVIIAGDVVIMAVLNRDAEYAGMTRDSLAQSIATILRSAIQKHYEAYSGKGIATSIGIVLGLFFVLLLLILLLNKYYPLVYPRIIAFGEARFRSIQFFGTDLVSKEEWIASLVFVVKMLRFIITAYLVYLFLIFSVDALPWTQNLPIQPILLGLLKTIILTIIAVALQKGLSISYYASITKTEIWKKSLVSRVRIKGTQLLSEERLADVLIFFLQVMRILAYSIFIYVYVTLLFSFFSFSESWADTLFGYILTPLTAITEAIIGYLPEMFTIAIILLVMRYLNKLLQYIFEEIKNSRLVFESFHPDWADPTFKIVRFLLQVFTLIIIFPYLPGSDSPIFQGISLFVGILFSLGSTSAIANVVAGVVLTYMRPFKLGDRVKIADTMGDVIEKTLLVTRVRTPKNVDITVPNAMVLGSHIINYSSSAIEKGLILHSTVTIGYDVPWKQVHDLLITAALRTEGVLKDPKPFVLQTSLQDYYPAYEVNAYTHQANSMAGVYSDLHANIQDVFNEAGVEIMSPAYNAVRDGNQTTIPQDYLPKEYQAPAFRIFPFWGDKK